MIAMGIYTHLAFMLILYVFFYGGAHAYFFSRLTLAFPAMRFPRALVFSLSTFLVATPLLVLAPGGLLPTWLRRVCHAGTFSWMGFLCLFTCVAVFVETSLWIYRWVCSIRAHSTDDGSRPLRMPMRLALIVSVGLCIYGAIEAAIPRVTYLTLRVPTLPPGARRIRVVHLADLHLGATMRGARLARVITVIQAQQPDVIVSSGDLLDSDLGLDPRLAQMLRELRPRYGKFACPGNHEGYVGQKRVAAFCQAAGFTLLEDQGLLVAEDQIAIIGVRDPGPGIYHGTEGTSETALWGAFGKAPFVLILKHRPDVSRMAIAGFGLQLSGHLHGGQIFPFHLLVRYVYPVCFGLSRVGPRGFLHVSRGAGTWGPPIRLGAPPEIAVIDILP